MDLPKYFWVCWPRKTVNTMLYTILKKELKRNLCGLHLRWDQPYLLL